MKNCAMIDLEMIEKAPRRAFTVTAPWTTTALVVAALMRRMGVTEVNLTPEEIKPRGGIILLSERRVQLQDVIIRADDNDIERIQNENPQAH